MSFDDSALFHGTYDPVKAREYYLRTRQLKGRRKTSATLDSPGRGGRRPAGGAGVRIGGKPNRSNTKSRQAQLKAEKAALEKRLDRLREVLQMAVEAAKGRSGVKKPENQKAPETQADKADRNKAKKGDKPTATEKRKKNEAARKEYEKEHPTSLSTDIKELHAQIADIRAKIETTMAEARRKKAGSAAAKSGSKNNNDGPRGR